VKELFKQHERRDPAEVLPATLPEPIAYASQRDFVRAVVKKEVDLRADGADFVDKSQEPQSSLDYRKQMNSQGSPSQTVAAGYKWTPGTELKLKVVNL
jgi:hypothetical protein